MRKVHPAVHPKGGQIFVDAIVRLAVLWYFAYDGELDCVPWTPQDHA